MHYQQTTLQMTQSFLAAQQAVMLCYLQTKSFEQRDFPVNHRYPNQPPTPFQMPVQALHPMPVRESKQLLVPGAQQTALRAADPGLNLLTAQPASGLNLLHHPTAWTEVSTNTRSVDAPELVELLTDATPLESAMELDDDALVAALLQLVSERTGYPVEMLEPNLDLESDLGIDSIKRIEILNKFQTFLPAARRALLETAIEDLAGARTLNQIIDWVTKPLVESVDQATVNSLTLEE